MAAPSTDSVVKLVAIGAGLLLADEVFGLFSPDHPGGNVTPGEGDQRPATINTADARALADRIDEDVWGDSIFAQPWERDEDIAAALMVCRVTNDLRLVMNEYGSRGQVLSPLNLVQTVTQYLDSDYKAAVNADYFAKGITITF